MPEQHSFRGYRAEVSPTGLDCYRVALGESDLYVCTLGRLEEEAAISLAAHRRELEEYLKAHVTFGTSFRPVPAAGDPPAIVVDMASAAVLYDVGPMASVAGAIAQYVGTDLLNSSGEVIVENGGDLFLAGTGTRNVRVFAGEGAPEVNLKLRCRPDGVGLCTSSASIGPSVSLGNTEAVTVLAGTATLADAAASAIGNRVLGPDDIPAALEFAKGLDRVEGVLVVAGGSVGIQGELELA
jgi:ApbE superfamily uncharacterized protein (UPF0280 family)